MSLQQFVSREWVEFLRLRDRSNEFALPNLIGVGAARCGTTSLYHTLRQCDEIFMSPVKELSYFSHQFNKWTEEEYRVFFSGKKPEHKYVGEITPHYLHSEESCNRISELIPDCKIIILLRNPVKRAISHFKKHFEYHKIQKIDKYFRIGIDQINTDKQLKFHHPVMNLRQGFYFESINRYLGQFPRENLFIGTLDEMKGNTSEFGNKLSTWLGVNIEFETEAKNKSQKIPGIGSLTAKTKSRLEKLYSEDFNKTLNLLGLSKEDLQV